MASQTRQISVLLMQCRYYASGKIRPKWQMVQRRKTGRHLALKYFDDHYGPYFGKSLWPSIRLALLSQQKYGAMMNNYAFDENDMLSVQGAELLSKPSMLSGETGDGDVDDINEEGDIEDFDDYDDDFDDEEDDEDKDKQDYEEYDDYDDDFHDGINIGRDEQDDALDVREEFMPSPKMKLKGPHGAVIEVEKDFDYLDLPRLHKSSYQERFDIPAHLKVYTFPRGDIRMFPEPRVNDVGLMGYYLLDAASVLPVIALNLVKSDVVLDLCAAPGGKSLAIAQTLSYEMLVSNEVSYKRRTRLHGVLSQYLPQEVRRDQVLVTRWDGTSHVEEDRFDKVLVDAPCTTDRHVLFTDDNNIFALGRAAERHALPELQADLLLNGVRSCRAGGSVVYSTCTMSPIQNDGVVSAVVSRLSASHPDIRITISDLSPLVQATSHVYTWYPNTRYGQLVVPSVHANCGPIYVCKINRLA